MLVFVVVFGCFFVFGWVWYAQSILFVLGAVLG